MINRREFFKTFVRGSIITGLGTLTGIAIHRNLHDEGSCEFDFVCRICKKRRSCNLPEAINFRSKFNI